MTVILTQNLQRKILIFTFLDLLVTSFHYLGSAFEHMQMSITISSVDLTLERFGRKHAGRPVKRNNVMVYRLIIGTLLEIIKKTERHDIVTFDGLSGKFSTKRCIQR